MKAPDRLALLEALPALVWATDAHGRLVHVNRRYSEHVGRPAAESVAAGTLDLHPDDEPLARGALRAALARRAAFEHEARLRRADGTYRRCALRAGPLLDERGRLDGYVGTCADAEGPAAAAGELLGARHADGIVGFAMEQAVREREHWLKTTLRSIGEAVVATDPEGRIMFMNPEAEGLLGRAGAACAGRPVGEVVALRVEPGGRAGPPPTGRAFSERRAFPLPPGTLLVRAGRDVPIQGTAAPILDDRGRLLGTVLVVRDISEQRRLERRLAASARLAAIGTIAAGIAHEVNNPLSWVTSNVSLVAGLLRDSGARLSDPDLREAQTALAEATLGANRVARILRGLRIFARGVDGGVEGTTAVAIGPVVRSVLIGLDSGRARFALDLDDAPAVEANEDRLAEVLTHLLANALQAGATEVRIATGVDPEGRAVIEITDDGDGMAAEVRDRLFDPFFTTKGPSGGSGLGLAFCHGIIVAMGGTIDVESAPGVGSRFRLVLPAASGLAEDADART